MISKGSCDTEDRNKLHYKIYQHFLNVIFHNITVISDQINAALMSLSDLLNY